MGPVGGATGAQLLITALLQPEVRPMSGWAVHVLSVLVQQFPVTDDHVITLHLGLVAHAAWQAVALAKFPRQTKGAVLFVQVRPQPFIAFEFW